MHRRVIGIVAAVVGLMVIGGSASAAIPDAGGVLHGCYTTRTTLGGPAGSLRVIDAPTERCRAGETAVDWNQRGPAGPQGPAGLPGPKGDAALPVVHRAGALSVAIPVNENVQVAALDVPTGTYLIMAKATVSQRTRGTGTCYLVASGTGPLDAASYGSQEPEGLTTPLSLLQTWTLTAPGTLRMICNVSEFDASVLEIKLVATPVGAVLPE